MQPPSHVPGMAGAPLLGQREQQAKTQIMQAVQHLSLGIYSHLAVNHIGSRDKHQTVEPEHLRGLARDAYVAAQAFFEGLGVVQFQEDEASGSSPS